MEWYHILIIVLAIAVVIGIAVAFMAFYNNMIKKRNKAEEAFSTMDVYLKKRYDLVPNLVETVKGYAKHEKEALTGVMQARNSAMNAKTATERIENDNILTGTLKSLFAVSEAYPDLKANANFLSLQKELSALEVDISSARKYYNAIVNDFNTYIEKFPANMFAKIYKFKRKPLYEVEGAEQRESVKVSFE